MKKAPSQPSRRLKIAEPGSVDFSSNDYLGLARSPLFLEKVDQVGSTGSRLLTGNTEYAEQLEQDLAQIYQGEAALLFSSGYTANLGLLSCLAGERDLILLDKECHASLWDGARLSRAAVRCFHHNDLAHLEKQLQSQRDRYDDIFVSTESLYSISGTYAPLDEIATLCERFGAHLLVDEAHTTGIGAPFTRAFARTHTFSKALGCQGAAIVGSEALRHHLINFSRPFIYSTAPIHLTLAAIRAAHKIVPTLKSERNHLQKLVSHLGATSHIHNITIPGAEAVVKTAEQLQARGFDIRPIRHPTVRRGEECLRLTLHSYNTTDEIDRLKETLQCI